MGGHRYRAVVAMLAVLLIGLSPVSTFSRASALQPVPGLGEGIVVTGLGIANGPASEADIEVVIGADQYGPMPSAMSEDDIAPIVAAIVAAGVAEAGIEITIPATNSMFTGPGPGGARLRFQIAVPTQSGMTELAETIQAATQEARLSVQHIGARYLSDDCAALQQAAADAAVADGRERAERLARSLGVELGELVQAMELAYFDPAGGGSCGLRIPGMFGQYGPGMEQPFDPALPVEATVSAQITLTFAMGAASEATPEA